MLYRNQLNDWLKAKGKTPSKFRHLMCFHAELEEGKSNDPQTKASLSVEELTEQVNKIYKGCPCKQRKRKNGKSVLVLLRVFM